MIFLNPLSVYIVFSRLSSQIKKNYPVIICGVLLRRSRGPQAFSPKEVRRCSHCL